MRSLTFLRAHLAADSVFISTRYIKMTAISCCDVNVEMWAKERFWIGPQYLQIPSVSGLKLPAPGPIQQKYCVFLWHLKAEVVLLYENTCSLPKANLSLRPLH